MMLNRRKQSRPARSEARSLVRYSERALLAMGVVYIALHVYPQVLFAHSFSQDGITVYSRAPLSPSVADRTTEIAGLLSRSELAVPGQHHSVFVCNHPWLFRLFSPVHGRSFAVSVPLTNHVFVADADLASNTARSGRPRFNQRSFSGVVAHEITHRLIRARVGLARGLRLESWVEEGYPDYVAGEGSFPEREGLALLAEGGSDPSRSFQYFLWRQMVEHLIDDRGLAFDDLVAMAHEADRVETETRAALATARQDG